MKHPLLPTACAFAAALPLLVAPVGAAPARASSSAPAASAPAASRAIDQRSEHLRLRQWCVDAAKTQGLQGEDARLSVQRCLLQGTPAARP